MNMLGHAQLLDPALGGRLAVALGVGGREVALDGGVLLVGTKVDVVVGQHGERRVASAMRRSRSVVTLRLSGDDSTTRTVPPARSTSEASSVAASRTSVLVSR